MSPSRASRRGAVTVSMPEMSSTTSSRHAVDVVVDDVTYVVKNAKASGGGDDDDGKAREGDASERRGEETIALLRGVSSAFERGGVHALMGASGAGKTTLMDVMCSRVTAGETSGRVTLGGVPASKETFKAYAAYVEQFDTLLPMLTVRETLRYWAELRARTSRRRRSDGRGVECIRT
jgi:ABC-type multidrug transport system ATPase subunit